MQDLIASRLNAEEYGEVIEGYKSLNAGLEGALERAARVIYAQQKEIERLTSLVIGEGDNSRNEKEGNGELRTSGCGCSFAPIGN